MRSDFAKTGSSLAAATSSPLQGAYLFSEVCDLKPTSWISSTPRATSKRRRRFALPAHSTKERPFGVRWQAQRDTALLMACRLPKKLGPFVTVKVSEVFDLKPTNGLVPDGERVGKAEERRRPNAEHPTPNRENHGGSCGERRIKLRTDAKHSQGEMGWSWEQRAPLGAEEGR